MPPPPGSRPHPIGHGVAVAVRQRPGRRRALLVSTVVLALSCAAVLTLLVLATQTSPMLARRSWSSPCWRRRGW
ncbi:hypothetical protein [Desertihabitans brevis]|uniref:hypothetical protein n=1 Tax=Desertihabitans brevis TaxID=2268447 RepID=UPI0011BE0BCD|nr:hypothetical protein [Desertihabitans brevis]